MHYRTLITVQALFQAGPPPDWVIIDCRFDLADRDWGWSGYREGHIPGAFYAPLEFALSDAVTPGSGRHPLPDWNRFAGYLGEWGVHPASQVVVYDQHNGAYAARLWWLLRAVGHTAVALLDGGWAAWLAAGGGVSRETPAAHARSLALGSGSGWVTSREVESNLQTGEFLLVDARSEPRYRGEQEPIDTVAGHIPAAINFPFTRNLRDDGRFLPLPRLGAQWSGVLGARPATEVVHMCGSGVTACHNLLAMEHAGLAGSRLYVGSWSEWIRDPRRPVVSVAP